MISEILPVFSRKPLFGYRALVFSVVAIAFLGFLVWGHHMFAVGFATPLHRSGSCSCRWRSRVPTGVKIFNWIGTMWVRPDHDSNRRCCSRWHSSACS